MSQFGNYWGWIADPGEAWSEPCGTLEEARAIPDYYPGGRIYRRGWTEK